MSHLSIYKLDTDIAIMGRIDLPPPESNKSYPPPAAEDELVITIEQDWTDEERKAKRKYEACCLSTRAMRS
jgi:hypothetical protein